MNRSLWVLREQINEFESQIIIRHEGLNEQAPKIPTTGPVKQYLYKKMSELLTVFSTSLPLATLTSCKGK